MGIPTSQPLPIGTYTALDPRASSKRLIGCMVEPLDPQTPQDDKQTYAQAFLRRFAGIRTLYTDSSAFPVRGFWEMGGIEYAVIGPNLYQLSVDPITQNATAIQLNGATPITGNSFVRMTDNGVNAAGQAGCLLILQPGTSNAWTYCPNNGGTNFQTLSAAFFTGFGAMDCWFIDSYIVFLSVNGSTFFNDDGRGTSGNNQITFTTTASFGREFGTDMFVGGTADHRELMLFGTRTTEGYINAGVGVTGTPFQSDADSFMEIGCHPLCGYTIAKQDQSVLWVANDLTVRRRNGQTPTRVSNSGIEQILQQINTPNGNQGTLLGAYALTPTVTGHPLWILQLPNAISPDGTRGRSLVYDCLTQEWFELASYQPNGQPLGMWRVLCYHNGVGGQLVGDSLTSQIGILDTTIFQEFGSPMLCEWAFQALYNGNQRFSLRRIEAVVTPGNGVSQSNPPTIDLFTSTDGLVFESTQDLQNLGGPGETDHRAIWFNMGQFRSAYTKCRVTDPTETFVVDSQATIEPGIF